MLCAARLPWLLAGVVVALQVAYPLVHGSARQGLIVATVLAFAAATLAHLAVAHGRRAALTLLAVAGGIGLTVEVLGVHTGVPFGSYDYSGHLGLRLAGVPVVIGLAWTMMAWPALAVARRLASRPLATAAAGAVGLAGWDLFLDPQMVSAGNWVWHLRGPALQGIPLTNDLGWLIVAFGVMALLDRLLPRGGDTRQPVALFGWTYLGSVLANAAFFGRPGVALVGGVGMGLVAVPLLVGLARRPAPLPRPRELAVQ